LPVPIPEATDEARIETPERRDHIEDDIHRGREHVGVHITPDASYALRSADEPY
jgi:hypothetical protein